MSDEPADTPPAEPPAEPQIPTLPSGKPVQKPDYVKNTIDRRTLIKRLVGAGGILGATSYAALAPHDWPLSMRDDTGLLSVPRVDLAAPLPLGLEQRQQFVLLVL